MIRLVCTGDGSSKFWQAEVVGKTLKARWGRIGTDGQAKDKAFASPAAAAAEYDKLVREKTGKGYRVEGASGAASQTPPKRASKAATPAPAKNLALASSHATGENGSSITANVITDAGTIVLFDAKHFAKVVDQETWQEQFVDDEEGIERHQRLKHMAVLLSGSDGAFRVDVRHDGALTPAEEKKVAERATSTLVSKGAVFVGGIEHVAAKPDAAAATAVPLAAGTWSVTTCVLDGGTKMADVVILLAPVGSANDKANATATKATQEKAAKHSAKDKAAASAGAPPKNLKQACEAAALGEIDRALPVLEAEAAKGKASAWSALSQIRAYRGDWDGALEAVTKFLADPNDIYAGNVMDDAHWLLLRAGHATQRWADVERALSQAKPLREGRTHPIAARIREQAGAKGKLADPPFTMPDEQRAKLTPEQLLETYDKWMRAFDDDKKKKRKPGDRDNAQFAYASGYGQDAIAMEVWPAVEPGKLWHDAVKAARIFLRNGRKDEAWSILERKVRHFWPVEGAQVAPIEPLADDALRPIITPERLLKLLATPKNQEL